MTLGDRILIGIAAAMLAGLSVGYATLVYFVASGQFRPAAP